MGRAVDEARVAGADVLWLGVWERNERAIGFYRRCGLRSVVALLHTAL
jgi:diamine N-acetyltransferase